MLPSPKLSDRSNRDFRSNDSNGNSNSSKYDKEKGVNVQVIVRCR
jgi:kinesin family member 11